MATKGMAQHANKNRRVMNSGARILSLPLQLYSYSTAMAKVGHAHIYGEGAQSLYQHVN
jgi:hypothetical protein